VALERGFEGGKKKSTKEISRSGEEPNIGR